MNPEIKALLEELKSTTAANSKKYDSIGDLIEQKTKGYISQESFDNNVKEQKTDALKLEQKLDTLESLMKRPNIGGQGEFKSIGRQLAETDQFKKFAKNEVGSFQLELKNITNVGSQITTGTSNALAPNFRDRMGGVMDYPFSLREIIPIINTTSNMAEIPKELTRTQGEGVVAEGGPKSQSDATFGVNQIPIQKIAHFITLTSEALADGGNTIEHYVNNRLITGLYRREDNQILAGTGASPQLFGLNHVNNSTAYNNALITGGAAATFLDKIRWAKRQMATGVITDSYYSPDTVILNGQDWAAMELLKDTTNRYIVSNPFMEGQVPRLWGMRVIENPAQTVGQALIADISFGTVLYVREDIMIRSSSEHSTNFTNNLVTILAEERVALGVYDSRAVIRAVA